jgi:Fe-S-cluster containining protein
MPTARYNCSKCPGYCCSYPIIPLTKTDLKRLARHFGLSARATAAKFTVPRGEDKYTMRRKADPHFGRICQFFDTEKRNCTIYEARPSACRSYPNKSSCGYYEFLKFERWLQDDPDFVANSR